MELYTESLLLKTVTDSDITEVARMWEFQTGPISHSKAKEAIDLMRDNHAGNKPGSIRHLCFAVYEKGGDAIVGWCGLDGTTEDKLHIFYAMDEGVRNRGYATQCAARLLSYAFEEAGAPFVNGGCRKDNIASFKVMTKIGMEQNGYEENGDPLFYIEAALYERSKRKE